MADTIIQLLEATMLICFGASWPIDILNTLKLRMASGKSLLFMTMILTGYVAGLASKFVRYEVNEGSFEPVCWLYIANIALVFSDLLLSYYYQKKENISF